MRSLNGWQPARFELRTCVRLMAGNQHVSIAELRTCVFLMAGNQHVSNCEHAVNMRSLNGWQPARFELPTRFELRTCVLLKEQHF